MSLDGGGGNPIATVIPDPCDPGNNLLHFAPVEWYQGFGWSEDPGQWDPKTNGGMSIEWRINVTAGYQFAPLETSSPLAGRWMTTYVYPGFPDGKAELRDRDRAPRLQHVTGIFEDSGVVVGFSGG